MPSVILFYPKTGWDRPGLVSLPLSVLHVGSYLADKGIEVGIIDARTSKNWQKQLASALQMLQPLFLGISAMTGLQISGGIEAAKIAKKESPSIPVVWGGVHPSLLPGQTLESGYADIMVMGEGEATALDLTDALIKGRALGSVKGISFRSNGDVLNTPPRPFLDLDSLPPLQYDLLDMSKYITSQVAGEADLRISTSRGCIHRCSYCYNDPFNKRIWRGLSAGKVVSGMEGLSARYGIKSFYLGDDDFFYDKERVEEVCGLLADMKASFKIKANCLLTYLMTYDDRFLKNLKEAGFVELYIGVESASGNILASMKRNFRPEDVTAVNRKLKGEGISPIYSFMAGFPGETTEDVKETLMLMRRLLCENPSARVSQLHLLAVYPGTEIHEKMKFMGVSLPQNLSDWSKTSWNTINYPWLSKSHRSFLVRASFFTGFLDGKTFPAYFLNNAFLRAVSSIYSLIIRLRISLGFYALMPEIILMRLFLAKEARAASGS